MPVAFIPARIEAVPGLAYGSWQGLPVSGPISSPFDAFEGFRADLGWTRHKGIDIVPSAGTGILAPADWTCMFSLGGVGGSLGNFVILQHELSDGSYIWTGFAHMLFAPAVRAGQRGLRGEPIGVVGWSGSVTPEGPAGAHLHFSVMSMGNYFEPLDAANEYYDPAALLALPAPATPPVVQTWVPGAVPPALSPERVLALAYELGNGTVVVPAEVFAADGQVRYLSIRDGLLRMVPAGTPVARHLLEIPLVEVP